MITRVGWWSVVALAAVLAMMVLGSPAGSAPAVAQTGGCSLQRRFLDADTNRPIVGARVTLIETGATTVTGQDGGWSLATPAAGTFTVTFSHPSYVTHTRQYMLDAVCTVVSSIAIDSPGATAAAGPSPAASPTARPGARPPATPTPRPSASAPPRPTTAATATPWPVAFDPTTGQRLSGRITIEGRPAPAGTTVEARVGETVCGRQKTTVEGRYVLDVAPARLTRGCGVDGQAVTIHAAPEFGGGWQVESISFATGTTSERDLSLDPRLLEPRADNVPWTSAWWRDSVIRVGVCGDVSATSRAAVRAALAQWQDAARTGGLRFTIVADGATACSDTRPGIAVIEDELEDENAVAGAGNLDERMRPCPRQGQCWSHKGIVIINKSSFPRLSDLDRPNVIAHEIGHALGLGHAYECSGGTIMWADTRCRYPLSAIGVDDIASLNQKLAEATAEGSSFYRAPRPDEAAGATAAEPATLEFEGGAPLPAATLRGVVHWTRLSDGHRP